MIEEEVVAQRPRTIINPVIKDRVTFVRTSEETGGVFTEVSVMVMPGGGTPFHFHKVLTETFYVESGELSLSVDGKQHVLSAGASMAVVPGSVHRFFNASDRPVRFYTIVTPGSTGFERSLRILYGLAADGLTNDKAVPRSLKHIAVISRISDMHSTGLLSLMSPWLRRLAQKARMSGEEEALINRYCV